MLFFVNLQDISGKSFGVTKALQSRNPSAFKMRNPQVNLSLSVWGDLKGVGSLPGTD